MVILDPDIIPVFDDLDQFIGKDFVGLLVCVPVRFPELELARMVMEQRPSNAVREAIVVAFSQLVREKYRQSRIIPP